MVSRFIMVKCNSFGDEKLCFKCPVMDWPPVKGVGMVSSMIQYLVNLFLVRFTM